METIVLLVIQPHTPGDATVRHIRAAAATLTFFVQMAITGPGHVEPSTATARVVRTWTNRIVGDGITVHGLAILSRCPAAWRSNAVVRD